MSSQTPQERERAAREAGRRAAREAKEKYGGPPDEVMRALARIVRSAHEQRLRRERRP